ncbi:MAG: hypothetical protein K2X81_02470 [Candidatus Obscuribacterales bacterium]|nr:hypothetical protein [Candidatus Obscuribacterales bacterium]
MNDVNDQITKKPSSDNAGQEAYANFHQEAYAEPSKNSSPSDKSSAANSSSAKTDAGDEKKEKSTLPDLSLDGLDEEDRKDAIEHEKRMTKATDLAKPHLDEALKMLKGGDFKGLMDLAQELNKKSAYGDIGLSKLMAEKTGLSFSFIGGGKGGLDISFDYKGFDKNTVDQIREWKGVRISDDGKIESAYHQKSGGYFGINQNEPIDATQASKQMYEIMANKAKEKN